MNIALLGYGKMGKQIEAISLKRNHTIVLKTTSTSPFFELTNVDVAIDFSSPSAAKDNIIRALDAGVPVVSGTTGWLEHYKATEDYCNTKKGTFLYASNFSLGVNVFFEINKKLSQLMADFNTYSVDIKEIHHTQKRDAPSGTAITLAEQIIASSAYNNWVLDTPKNNEIGITAIRKASVPGTHKISYTSKTDTISIKHEAHNRQGFALGAVIAAEWIKDKKGIFTMQDVLNIG